MKRTDEQLRQDVVAELRWDPSIRDEEIAVTVKDGVATLGGTVDSYPQKRAAERAAERVSGVRAVAEGIKVKPPSAWARSDTEIAHAAADVVRWDVDVPKDKVKVKVENGWITLEGNVEWKYQRDAAERAVQHLMGVKGVVNLLTIQPRASTFDVSKRIKDALRRQAELDADKIDVEAHDGVVTLKGTVSSWAERMEAESAAWGAEGVTRVEDELKVHL